MSNILIYRWLELSFWLRSISLFFTGCLLVAAVWLIWARSVSQQASGLAEQQLDQARRYQAALHQVRETGVLRHIEAEIARLQTSLLPETRQAFSLPTLLENAGGELALWQPVDEGGDLTLSLNWPQVQKVFLYLSDRRPTISLPYFTLKRERGQLRLQIVLVPGREA